MAELDRIYVNEQLIKLWKQQLEQAKAMGEVFGFIKGNFMRVNLIHERVSALELLAGVATGGLAETRQDLEALEQRVDAVAAGLQHTQDMVNLEDLEQRLAAEGIAPPEDAP